MPQTCVSLSLGGIAAQVGHQANAEWVGVVQALDDAQVSGCLSQTLAEAQATIIHCQSMSVKVT